MKFSFKTKLFNGEEFILRCDDEYGQMIGDDGNFASIILHKKYLPQLRALINAAVPPGVGPKGRAGYYRFAKNLKTLLEAHFGAP